MFQVLAVLGQVMKAVLENAVMEAVEVIADPVVKQQVQAATSGAINNVNTPNVIGLVTDHILPHATINWTPAQLLAGESAYTTAAGLPEGISNPAFEAGAIWARNLAAQSIVDGVNAANGFTPDVLKLALDAAAGAVSGGPAGAILAAVPDVGAVVTDIAEKHD